jgi:hypothetical protein
MFNETLTLVQTCGIRISHNLDFSYLCGTVTTTHTRSSSQVVFLIKLQGAHMTIIYNPSELQRTVHKKVWLYMLILNNIQNC